MRTGNTSDVAGFETDPPIENSDVDLQLVRILSSTRFKKSQRLAEFLRFVVQETLRGRADFIKARTVAIQVLGRNPSENPDNDPIVRIHAGRLRRTLTQYYKNEGAQDPILIEIPKGAYVPLFSSLTAVRVAEGGSSPTDTAKQELRLPRIGVLPLVNLGDLSEYEYFADGLGEELSRQLARFQGLAVLAYWTTSQIRGESRDVLKAGRELAVDFFISGSIARSDDRFRVSIQCVHVETGDHIWAERFDRRLTVDDLFDIQDEIVHQVVACVGDSFGSIPRTLYRASRGKSVNELTAYEATLANHHYLRRLDQQTHDHTRAVLEHAVTVEPSYALAWAMLSGLYCDIHAYKFSSLDEPLARADECAHRAITLDQNCQHSHYASALVGILTKDHVRIFAHCDSIVRLNPNAAFMVGAASIWLGIAGRFDQALPLLERSLELNPYHPGWFHFLPWLHAFTEKDYERALATAHQFDMPEFFWDPLIRAASLAKFGKEKEAQIAYQDVLNLCPGFAERPDHYVGCYVHSNDTCKDLLDGLSIAGLR